MRADNVFIYRSQLKVAPLSRFPVGTRVMDRQKAGVSHGGSATYDSAQCISRPAVWKCFFMEHCKARSWNVQA